MSKIILYFYHFKLYFVALILSSFVLKLSAKENHFVILGGGGDSLDSQSRNPHMTIFDSTLENLADYVNSQKKFKTSVAFNGGHSNSEDILQNRFQQKQMIKQPFTSDSFNQLLDDLELKIKNKTISKNDQILLTLPTHGLPQQSTATHSISLGGKDNQMSIPLDRLSRLADLADKIGIQLGIVDLSCYSGNTLKIKNKNTCIISAAESNNVGFIDFSNLFSLNMKSGKSLEQVFLESRDSEHREGFPQISSPAGLKTQKLFEQFFSFLYVNNDDQNQIKTATTFLKSEINKVRELNVQNQGQSYICEQRNLFEKSLSDLKSVTHQIKPKYKNNIDDMFISSLIDDLTQFKNKQLEYITTLSSISNEELNTVGGFIQSTDGMEARSFTKGELLITDFEELIINAKSDLKLTEDIKKKDLLRKKIYFYEQLQIKKTALLQEQKYKDYAEKFKTLDSDLQFSMEKAKELSKKFSILYKAYYQSISEDSEIKKQDNPCAKFKL